MALITTAPVVRYAGTLVLIVALSGVLAGCTPGAGSRQTFNDTEKVKVTEIVIDGGSGDVTVQTSAINETRITKVVRSREDDVGKKYSLDGTVLHVDTNCPFDCNIAFVINAPTGVRVSGALNSGTIALTDVSTVDVAVSSGDITVTRASGAVKAEATSGNIVLTDVQGTTNLVATSGDIRGRGLSGAVDAHLTSGELDVQLAKAAPVKIRANSGDVRVGVPTGKYRLQVTTDSGDRQVGVTDTPNAPNLIDVSVDSGDVAINQI